MLILVLIARGNADRSIAFAISSSTKISTSYEGLDDSFAKAKSDEMPFVSFVLPLIFSIKKRASEGRQSKISLECVVQMT